MIPNVNKLNLSVDDIVVLTTSLNFFVSNSLEEVSANTKFKNNLLANSVLSKIKNRDLNFNAEELRILYVSLLSLKLYIDETSTVPSDDKFKKDTKKYLSIINNLLNIITFIFESNGIHLIV